jgi:predicted nucleic acid-binding protein
VVVVDASAILVLLLNLPSAARLRQRLFWTDEILQAPHLIDAEVLHTIRRLVLAGEMDEEKAARVLRTHLDQTIERYPHDVLLGRAWEWRSNVTAYDAMYLALAESLDVPLVTTDARLAKAAPSGIRVEVF